MLPKQAIKEFKELYFKKYKVKLTDEEAVEKASNLFTLFKSLVEPEKESLDI